MYPVEILCLYFKARYYGVKGMTENMLLLFYQTVRLVF